MSRKFRTAQYEEILNLDIKVSEVLPPNHLARFVVDTIGQLDLSSIYQRYSVEAEKRSRRKSCWGCCSTDRPRGV